MDDRTWEPMIHDLDIVEEIGELGKDLVALHGINLSMLSRELNEYMKALKIEEIDIDKEEVTLENMRHLGNIKEYGVTKVDFEDISSTVTIMAWAVATLVMLFLVAGCCKCCSPCATVGKSIWTFVECVFSGLWKICKCLIGLRESDSKDKLQEKK